MINTDIAFCFSHIIVEETYCIYTLDRKEKTKAYLYTKLNNDMQTKWKPHHLQSGQGANHHVKYDTPNQARAA